MARHARSAGGQLALVYFDIDHSNTAAVEAVAEKILEVPRTHFELQGQIVRVSTSIGVVTIPHDKRITADDLIRNADSAMCTAKTAGRNAFRTARNDSSATS